LGTGQNLQTGVVSGKGDLTATNKILVGPSVVLIIWTQEKIKKEKKEEDNKNSPAS
jgi:hypothetical protein